MSTHAALGTSISAIGLVKQTWNPLKISSKLLFWVKEDSRSGLILTDSVNPSNNISILPAYYSKPLGTDYAYVADNGGLDIGANDFTICGWVKPESADKASLRYLFGKSVFGALSGRYGFGVVNTTGLIFFNCETSGGAITINSNIDFTTVSQIFICATINQTTKKINFYTSTDGVNLVLQGVETAFTGTFAATANAFKFLIGAGNDATGANVVRISYSSFSDVAIYHRVLSNDDMLLAAGRNYVANPFALWPCVDEFENIYDACGNYHLTISNPTVKRQDYSSFGSKYGLDKGYSVWECGYGYHYIPLKIDGTLINSVKSNQNIHSTHVGDLLNHNLANSDLVFVNTEWDRSDATRYSDLARSLKYRYISGTPKRWNIELINNLLFNSWANTGYKKTNLSKISTHSYKDRSKLLEIVTTSSDLADSDYSGAMRWASDYVLNNLYENDYIQWEISSTNQFAIYENKALRFDVDTATVYLSIDSGVTWPYSKAMAGLTNVSMGFIFPNGNILFAGIQTTAKMWLSTDNLANVNEITPLDLAGDPYLPPDLHVYTQADVPVLQTIGTKDVFVYGVYTFAAVRVSIIWYSIDYGVTVKMAYLSGTTLANPMAHFHGIKYNPNNGKFWAYTGDTTDECNIFEGTYNDVADTWAWSKIYGDNDGGSGVFGNNTYYKLGGLAFSGDYVYWASDSDNVERRSIYRCLYADFGTTSAYEKLLDNRKFAWGLKIIDGNLISNTLRLSTDEFNLILGKNLTEFHNIPLYNNVITGDYRGVQILGNNNDGWLIFLIQDAGEQLMYGVLKGRILKVKVK